MLCTTLLRSEGNNVAATTSNGTAEVEMTMAKRQRRISEEKKRNRLRGIARIPACTILLLVAVGATAQSNTGAASTSKQTPFPDATPTLHVSTNLKQVPVLVLTQDYERMKPIDPSGFRVSLDSGPRFRPTYVRREGEDPISLAILIDTTNPANELLPALTRAIAALPPDFLHPQDHVSVYAIACTLIRTAFDTPANSSVLTDAVQRAMAPWQIRQEQNQELKKRKKALPPSCKPTIRLWDSMAQVLDDLDQQSGRRVLLTVTDGNDTGSKTLWTKIMTQAQINSVTVFGLMPTQTVTFGKPHEVSEIFHVNSPFFTSPEDKFEQICVQSGGIRLHTSEHIAMFELKEFTQMLRERYILEFPRSPKEKAGAHTLAVSYTKKSDLYIAASGISVPTASEDESKGANTIQADPLKTPEEGDRKVLRPNQ
jgi:hypothetical protein